ncbi:MAG: TSUP family transporter [Kiloniellales bacterium]
MGDGALAALILVAVAMLCGGMVKGVVGLGLPIVSISIMSTLLNVPTALALLVGPILMSNLWQLLRGGYMQVALKRFWPVVLSLAVGLWGSASLVMHIPPRVLYGLLGAIVVTFTVTAYLAPSLRLAARAEKWVGVLAGFAGGLIGGISVVYGPPITMYLVALRLPKDLFIGAVGLIWFCGAVPLAAAYAVHGVLTAELAVWSGLACVPAAAGLLMGQWVRDRIDQELFGKVLLAALLLLGLNLIRRAFL